MTEYVDFALSDLVFSKFSLALVLAECCAPQPESAQVFCARGEREGSRVDRGRAGVSEEEVSENHRVQSSRIAIIPIRGRHTARHMHTYCKGGLSPLPFYPSPDHEQVIYMANAPISDMMP